MENNNDVQGLDYDLTSINLGEYDSEIEAAQAYNVGAILLEGENAELNPVPKAPQWIVDNVIRLLVEQGIIGKPN